MKDFMGKRNLFTEKHTEKMGYDIESMTEQEKQMLINRDFYEFLYDGWEALNYGEPPLSRQIFRGILKKVPECIDALNGLGALYLEEGKLKDARKYYEKAYGLTANPLIETIFYPIN